MSRSGDVRSFSKGEMSFFSLWMATKICEAIIKGSDVPWRHLGFGGGRLQPLFFDEAQ
jgi:hypothetical protein